ncbi:putative ribosomal RNA large subunit methyltransferase J [Halobacteriovorax sp. BALOs_7]|uniref:TlyA family RNA methyltransferase n=1 Tax=Halobacteriovorax sp. BALOs_7 TaxID=2109558 RepID=UPI000EA407BA|nr:TlyA family RNA methyltransferase [Halobacteriovorax sp. BALOs_7]AYF45764.1 putative ribosomal RNA large subunit methyltransferase J [Halobacteriovorax sp. BALOs_7]
MSDSNLERLDKKLADLGLVSTRSKAQQIIANGRVRIAGKIITKASYKVADEEIEIIDDVKEVGRGFHKLAGAFEHFNVDVKDKVVADVGASTGGFTQFCLGLGARKVFAIDVGHGQLDPSLISDERVVNLEGTNIRELNGLEEKVDLCVADLSFISLNLIWNNLVAISKDNAEMILLFKPQFEVGREGIGKKGLVKGREYVIRALEEMKIQCEAIGLKIKGFKPCVIKGRKSGNQEYFLYLDKSSSESLTLEELIKEVGE